MLKRFLVDGDSVSSSQHSFVTLAANPEIFENVKKVILDSISKTRMIIVIKAKLKNQMIKRILTNIAANIKEYHNQN